MSPFAQILVAGFGTYLFRVSFVAFAHRFDRIPRRVEVGTGGHRGSRQRQ